MSHYLEHVFQLSHAFHGATHSGRQLKIMWQGADTLFSTWLSLLRESCTTFVALFVLLPLTLFLNWGLGALLIVLFGAIGVLTWFVSGELIPRRLGSRAITRCSPNKQAMRSATSF
jgi:ATP-binding cassette, subfamily B, beta-glucan exporter